MEYKIPRILISAPQGRTGKTTVTLGLLSALSKMGYIVQSFKKGPDYIDPSWHTKVTGRDCRNLDCYMCDENTILNSFIKASEGSQISLIEGAMGLYDGLDIKGSGSTAQIAKITKTPVILVIDTRRMTRSAAALVMGFQKFDPEITIGGIILNRVARPRHEKMLRRSIEEYCGVPVVGSIPKDERMVIPDRHLGLIPAEENEDLENSLQFIGDIITKHVDLKKITEISNDVKKLELKVVPEKSRHTICKIRIGVIKDRVFSFYYPENLEALRANGAELIFIDSLESPSLPNIDALYIGGGFPEVFAPNLEKNETLREDIKKFAEAGSPIYAECGGLVYLGRKLYIADKHYDMVGVLPFDAKFTEKSQGHGYTMMRVIKENPFFTNGTLIKGHEFHNSKLINISPNANFILKVERGKGITGEYDGILYKNVFGSFNHIHALSAGDWAKNLIKARKR